MKKLLGLFLLVNLGLVFVLFGCSPPAQESTETDTGTSSGTAAEENISSPPPGLSFSYVVDDAWPEEQLTETSAVYYLDSSAEQTSNAPILVVEEFSIEDSVEGLDAQNAYLENTYLQSGEGITYTSMSMSSLNGNGCVTAQFTEDEDNKGIVMFFFTSPDTIGMIKYVAPEADFNEYLGDAETVMDTVEFY